MAARFCGTASRFRSTASRYDLEQSRAEERIAGAEPGGPPHFYSSRGGIDGFAVLLQESSGSGSHATGEHIVMVSLETSEGGKAGVRTEVPRAIAAKLIAEGRARVATEEEAHEFHEANREARAAHEQEEAAKRVQVMVIPAQRAQEARKSGADHGTVRGWAGVHDRRSDGSGCRAAGCRADHRHQRHDEAAAGAGGDPDGPAVVAEQAAADAASWSGGRRCGSSR